MTLDRSPGTLFVAVKGERVDGHAYVRQAVEAGAAALIVQDASSVSDHTVPTIELRDSRRALGLLAARLHNDPSKYLPHDRCHRHQWENHHDLPH